MVSVFASTALLHPALTAVRVKVTEPVEISAADVL
jgi:hypothetical protein